MMTLAIISGILAMVVSVVVAVYTLRNWSSASASTMAGAMALLCLSMAIVFGAVVPDTPITRVVVLTFFAAFVISWVIEIRLRRREGNVDRS